MKKIALSMFLAILLFSLPQTVSTSPGSEGSYVFDLKWGSSGSGNGQFNMPRGVAVDSDGNVYVADSNNDRIQKFDTDGGFLTKWGVYGFGDGEFDTPWDVAVDSDGNVYVTDWYNDRIQKFDTDGGFLKKWGVYGSGDGEFGRPRGITVDSDGNVYVADTNNHRIQKFNSSGGFIMKLGSFGVGDGEFYLPGDVAVDSDGNIYVADTYNHRIQKFDSDGGFLTKWGIYGSGDGLFKSPWGVSVDSDDNVYVADTSNNRIQKFDSSGGFIMKWGSWGIGDGEFFLPYDVAVDVDNNVFVVDTFNRRIQKFYFVPPLGVTSPNGGEILVANTTHDIIWETGVVNDYVKIEFSHNNGTDWEEVVASTENDGLYEDWYVPCNLSAECLVRITGLDDLLPDVSDDVFSIESSTPPVITLIGPPEIILECGIGTYEELGATAEDGCGNDVPVVIKGEDEVDTMICNTYIITYDAIDLSGQAATQVIRTVIIRDTTPPVPDVAPLPTLEGECSVEITTAPTASDSCAGSIEGTAADPLPITITGKGTHTVKWTYDDGNGNVTEQTQTVNVIDVTPPVPDVDPLPTLEGECSVEITTAPTATDNCVEGQIIGTTDGTLPITFTEKGTHTVKWTYDDGNGNVTEQTQTVNVIDVTPPVPDVDPLPTLEGECSVEITTAPTATDNCVDGQIIGITDGTLPITFTEHGTHTVKWVYDDGNGNITEQMQTVKVEDVTPPTIDLSDSTCVDVKKWRNANLLTVSASDNCSSDVEFVIDKIKILNRGGRRVWGRGIYRVVGNDIYVFPNGRDWSIVVTVTASDANGNTTTETISKPLQQCNRWSAKMARLIRLLYILMWKWHRCW